MPEEIPQRGGPGEGGRPLQRHQSRGPVVHGPVGPLRPSHRLLSMLARQGYRHPWSFVLPAVAFTFMGAWLALRLTLVTRMDDLIPSDNPRVRVFERLKKEVGSTTPLVLTITGRDVDSAAGFMVTLADSLERTPYIRWARFRTQRDFFRRNSLLYMDLQDLRTLDQRLHEAADEARLRQSPLYVPLDGDDQRLDLSDLARRYRARLASRGLEGDYFLTRSGGGVVLRLFPDGDNTDAHFANQLLARVRAVVAHFQSRYADPSIRVHYRGSFVNQLYDLNMIVHDARNAAVVGIAGVLLLTMLYFRQVLAPLLIVVPLSMSVAWTFGLTYLSIGSLNQVTVILFGVLFGLGIDFGIHIYARYCEARGRGEDVEDALVETVTHTGRALAAAALTTALAFYSLMFTEFKGFSQFGFIAGTGILFSFGAMVGVAPALVTLAERWGLMHSTRSAFATPRSRRGGYPRPWLTVALVAVIALGALGQAAGVSFDYDMSHLRYPPPPNPDGDLPAYLKTVNSPAIILARSEKDAAEVGAALEHTRSTRGDASTIQSVHTVRSLLPADQSAKMGLIQDMRRVVKGVDLAALPAAQRASVDSLRRLLLVAPLALGDLPRDLLQPFMSRTGDLLHCVIIDPAVQLDDGAIVRRFASESGPVRSSSGATYYASSSNLVFGEMMGILITDVRRAALLTLAVVGLVVLLDFRHVGRAILALIPLLVGLLLTVGVMGLLGMRFNFYNVVVFPSIIGMGIDNGIHILHRYIEEGAGSVGRVMHTTGRALAATSLTTMVGFSGLVFGHHPGLRSIGEVALLGLGACLLTSFTLLPALLQVGEKRMVIHPITEPAIRAEGGE